MLLLLLGCSPDSAPGWLTSPASPARGVWTLAQLTASDASGADYFGAAVDGAGDLNGDGFDDAVVGAQYIESAYVYYGSASGLSSADEDRLAAPKDITADWYGADVTGLGDVDGDGFDDLLIGAPADSDDAVTSGALFAYSGAAAGLDPGGEKIFPSVANIQQYFSSRLSEAGDLNADGFPDAIVSAHGNSNTATYAGAAYVLYGSVTGLGGEQLIQPSDVALYDSFGFSVSAAGDVNADGYDDVIVGSYGDDISGSAYLYYGTTTGLSLASEDKLVPSDGTATTGFGYAVSGASDLNGDGYDDVIVGTYQPGDPGSAYVYYGAASGIAAASEERLEASDGHAGNFFGMWVTDADDFDADGYADLIVSAPYDSAGGSQSGAAYLYYGAATGLAPGAVKLTAPSPTLSGYFGWSADSAGDLNGDGIPDLIIGAYGDSSVAAGAGAIYLYYGACTDADNDTLCAIDDCDDDDALIGDPVTFYADADGDGFGDPDVTAEACEAPSGYTGDDTDCLDTDADISPAGLEVCNGLDDDCDGLTDNDPTDPQTFYADADGDGFGDPDVTAEACEAPSGYTGDDTDCLDTDASIHPGAAEIADDGIDQDCDGIDLTTPADTGDSGSADTGSAAGECRSLGWSCATAAPGSLGWLVLLGLISRRRRRAR